VIYGKALCLCSRKLKYSSDEFSYADYKNTLQVRAEDPRLKSEYIATNPKREVERSRPCFPSLTKDRKLGGIVVVHEIAD